MGRYVRVLAESDRKAPLAELRTVLGPEFELAVEEGDEQDWSQVVMRHKGGPEIARVGRSREAWEIQRLIDGLQGCDPRSAVDWLRAYLPTTKIVYTLQLLGGTEVSDGWSAVHRIQAYFWKKFGGILQADGEGFTNREGRHILWLFDGDQTGKLEVAVLDEAGKWIPYTIEMSDPAQVESFRRGEIS